MPSNTTYNPVSVSDFEKNKLNYNGRGVSVTIPKGTSVNLDYTLTDDCLLTGVWLIIGRGNYGDSLTVQVLDLSNIYGYGAGAVLNTFVTNWYMPPSSATQIDIPYPAKIITGLTLRVIYTSTGTVDDPFLAINYKLHKVLV
jgi:hypothetical protein